MTRKLIIEGPFDLDAILEGTQDFRWRRWKDGWHSGVLSGHLLHVRQIGRRLEYRSDSDLDTLLRSYFRLDDDLDALRARVGCRDDEVARLVKKYPYLRVLRQPDPWECMVAYVCSANNSVDRIGAIVEKIAKCLGQPVGLDGDARHTFPSHRKMLEAGLGKLQKLDLGLDRAANIIDAAARMRDGKLDLRRLAQPEVSYAEAKWLLMGCRGIGPKIADCIALFALDKMEAFPVDRWVRRAVQRYFPCRQAPAGNKLAKWGQDYFGEYAGFANQLLFREQRELDNVGRST